MRCKIRSNVFFDIKFILSPRLNWDRMFDSDEKHSSEAHHGGRGVKFRVECPREKEVRTKVISFRSFSVLLEQRGIIPRVLTTKQVFEEVTCVVSDCLL